MILQISFEFSDNGMKEGLANTKLKLIQAKERRKKYIVFLVYPGDVETV